MALDKDALAAGMKSISDNPPTSHEGAAGLWRTEIIDYVSAVVPVTALLPTDEEAFESSLATAFASEDAVPGMETAFTTLGVAIGTGMAPAFTAVPPAGPVGWATLFSGTTDDTQEAADNIATAIDDWMKTGTATPSGGGSPVNWS